MIRSTADPAVDMYNVDNPVSLVGYLSRDQYGDWPIVYGQDFTDQPYDDEGNLLTNDGGPSYVKADGKYVVGSEKISYDYKPEDKHLFPRMWDASNDQYHANYYAGFLGIQHDAHGGWNPEDKPSLWDNVRFFMA